MELIFFYGRHCRWLLDGRIGKRALIERRITVGRWKLPLLVRSGIFCFFCLKLGLTGSVLSPRLIREREFWTSLVQGLIIWVFEVGGFIVCLLHGLAIGV